MFLMFIKNYFDGIGIVYVFFEETVLKILYF